MAHLLDCYSLDSLDSSVGAVMKPDTEALRDAAKILANGRGGIHAANVRAAADYIDQQPAVSDAQIAEIERKLNEFVERTGEDMGEAICDIKTLLRKIHRQTQELEIERGCHEKAQTENVKLRFRIMELAEKPSSVADAEVAEIQARHDAVFSDEYLAQMPAHKDRATLLAKVAQLEAALQEYGACKPTCTKDANLCTCGFYAALSAAEKPDE